MAAGYKSDLEKSSVTITDMQDKQEQGHNSCFSRTQKVSLKAGLIKQLSDGYALVVNQHPQIYGQCILVHNEGKEDMEDHSCQQKKRCNANKEKKVSVEGESPADKSFLSRESVNVFEPLSCADLKMLLDVNLQIDGTAFYQVLPRNAVNVFA